MHNMAFKCYNCGKSVIFDEKSQQWKDGDTIFPQYCWVDMAGGSNLHRAIPFDMESKRQEEAS